MQKDEIIKHMKNAVKAIAQKRSVKWRLDCGLGNSSKFMHLLRESMITNGIIL